MKSFDNIKKTTAKRMRLGVRYKDITYVDKNLIEARIEYDRLVDAVDSCRRLLERGPQTKHIAMQMAVFVISQAYSDVNAITSTKDLSKELGRLNGVLEEARVCIEKLNDCCPHVKAAKFALLYKQTSRKRDETSGWNRSAIEDDADDHNRISADVEIGFTG